MKSGQMNRYMCDSDPVVTGTRIPIRVLIQRKAVGESIQDIQKKYPELTVKQIADALHVCE